MKVLKNIKQNVVRDVNNYTYSVKGEIIPSANDLVKRIYPFNGLPRKSVMIEAVDRGNYIHTMIHDYLTGNNESKAMLKKLEKYYEENTIDVWHDASLNAIDALEVKFPIMDEWIVEIPLCHSRKKFAGTFDLVGRIGEEIFILDIKTSRDYRQVSSNVHDKKSKAEIQLAAYDLILNDMFKVEIDKFFILSVGFNGVEFVDIKPNHKLLEKALKSV